MLRAIALLPVLLFALLLSAAAQDIKLPEPLQPCECLECLKLMQLEAAAERKAYEDRWETARKELQKEIDRYNTDPAYQKTFDGNERILFCSLWSTLQDELTMVRKFKIPEIQKEVFGDDRKCGLLAGGRTNPATCDINQWMAAANEVSAPCPELHLSVLAHELVHVEDCEWDRKNTDWLRDKPPGENCWTTYRGKETPTVEQLMNFAHQSFVTEEHAHRIERQVEKLLANELTKQCKPDDYSSRMAKNFPEASKFLKRARDYKIELPDE